MTLGVARRRRRRKKAPTQRPPISISPPPPTTGIHVLHILGRLGAGGGVSREIGGGQMESHILCTPCPLAPQNGGSGGGRQGPRGPAGSGRSSPPAHAQSLPTFGGGGRREWRTRCEGAGGLLSPEDLHTPRGSVMTPCNLDTLKSPPPASRPFLYPTTTLPATFPAH